MATSEHCQTSLTCLLLTVSTRSPPVVIRKPLNINGQALSNLNIHKLSTLRDGRNESVKIECELISKISWKTTFNEPVSNKAATKGECVCCGGAAAKHVSAPFIVTRHWSSGDKYRAWAGYSREEMERYAGSLWGEDGVTSAGHGVTGPVSRVG